jgi:hypothetical protein
MAVAQRPHHVSTSSKTAGVFFFLLLFDVDLRVDGQPATGLGAAAAAAATSPARSGASAGNARCEPITVPLCVGIKYNLTRMPNLVGHLTQSDAAQQLNEFIPLVQIGCSRLLKFFLCSLYAPMCTEQVDEALVIPACRSMCLEVRSKCEPVLTRFNFRWPDVLDCSGLPDHRDRTNLCIDPPASDWQMQPPDGAPAAAPNSSGGSSASRDRIAASAADDGRTRWNDGNGRGEAPGLGLGDDEVPGNLAQNGEWLQLLAALRQQSATPRQTSPSGVGADNRATSVGGGGEGGWTRIGCSSDRFTYIESLGQAGNGSCTPRCGVDVLYGADDKRFAESWLTVWAVVCVTSSLLTVVTFLLDTARLRCPERPIIYLSTCYGMFAVSHLLRAVLGADAVSCSGGGHNQHLGVVDGLLQQTSSAVIISTTSPAAAVSQSLASADHLVRRGLDNSSCTVVFVLGYYFTQAASVWWVVLAGAWYLAAGRKWGV